MSARKRMSFTPEWEGVVEGWTVNYLHQNLWRVPRYMEFEDLKSDAYVRFLDCRDRYPNVIDAPHFMSLYKVSVVNHITDLSNKATKMKSEVVTSALESDGNQASSFLPGYAIDDDAQNQFLVTESLQEDADMQAVIEGFTNGKRPRYRRDKNTRKRECRSEYICRVANISYRKSIETEIRDFISGDCNVQRSQKH